MKPITRRQALSQLAATLATSAMGAGIFYHHSTRRTVLNRVSQWNDGFQELLFSQTTLAQEYPKNKITTPFRYNGILPPAYLPRIDPKLWKLSLSFENTPIRSFSLNDLRQFQQHRQTTKLICIEGWSAIGAWSGVQLSELFCFAGIDTNSKFVQFSCADGYFTAIDMESALHSQTILALDFLDRPLTDEFGSPARIRIPTKLGFKNAKQVLSIDVSNFASNCYWTERGYNWFAGL